MITKKHSLHFYLYFSVLILISLACNALTSAPADTNHSNTATSDGSKISNSAVPTATATKRPTATSRPPTETPVPTFTAAPLKAPVSNDLYEVRVITSRFLDKVYRYYSIGGGLEYTPNEGYTFLELGVKITNLNPEQPLTVKWENIYVIDKNNDAWYPNFAGLYSPKTPTEEVNPATIVFDDLYNLEDITLQEIIYIRVIWAVIDDKPTTYLFGFDTSPLIEIPRQ